MRRTATPNPSPRTQFLRETLKLSTAPTARRARTPVPLPPRQRSLGRESADAAAPRIQHHAGSSDLGVARTPESPLPRAPQHRAPWRAAAIPGPSRCQDGPSRLPARTCVGPAAASPSLPPPLSSLQLPPPPSSLTSFTDRNSRSGKTRCRSRKCAMRVVKSYSAILPGERRACPRKLY